VNNRKSNNTKLTSYLCYDEMVFVMSNLHDVIFQYLYIYLGLLFDIILFTTYPLLYVSTPMFSKSLSQTCTKNPKPKNSNWLVFCIPSYSTLLCNCIVSWTITTVLHVQYMACFVLQNLERPPEYEVKSCYLCFCAHETFRSC